MRSKTSIFANPGARRIAAGCILLLAAWGGAAQAAPPRIQLLDRIVAVVNNEVITLFELDEQVQRTANALKRQGTPLPPRDVLERQMLERLITDRVQLQLAKDTGVRVDDAQLDKTLQRIAQENKMSLETYRATLDREVVGGYFAFREEIREEILLARLREREVDNRVVVSEGEVDNYLATRATLQGGGESEYNLAHILVRVPEQASPEQVQEKKARAEKALSQIRNKADFAQIAASFSDAADALQGGQLGWRPGSRLAALFLETIATLKPGEVSSVVRSPNGFHIIKLIDRRNKENSLVVQKTHARHILIKASEVMAESDALHRLTQLKERIDNGADFGELAKLHSEDGSAPKGGDLGWASPGDMVPEFERAMDALKPGQISGIVRSPFGWHLIQVLERREEDVGQERGRMNARQEIKARKADESYEEWLRQLRDRAYVEYVSDER